MWYGYPGLEDWIYLSYTRCVCRGKLIAPDVELIIIDPIGGRDVNAGTALPF
jgi:hypothetical protein